MKIFLDTADLGAIKRASDTGLLDGITTNPSKILETGKSFSDQIREICKVVKGPVSAEAIANKTDDIIAEAVKIADIASNVVIKVPMTTQGLKASIELFKRGIKTNVTMVFSPDQALLAMKANATFVSIVLSRLDKIGGDVKALIEDTMKIKYHFGFKSEIIAASIKTRKDAIECMRSGVDIISVPENTFFDLFRHPQTEQGLAEFDISWKKLVEKGLHV